MKTFLCSVNLHVKYNFKINKPHLKWLFSVLRFFLFFFFVCMWWRALRPYLFGKLCWKPTLLFLPLLMWMGLYYFLYVSTHTNKIPHWKGIGLYFYKVVLHCNKSIESNGREHHDTVRQFWQMHSSLNISTSHCCSTVSIECLLQSLATVAPIFIRKIENYLWCIFLVYTVYVQKTCDTRNFFCVYPFLSTLVLVNLCKIRPSLNLPINLYQIKQSLFHYILDRSKRLYNQIVICMMSPTQLFIRSTSNS